MRWIDVAGAPGSGKSALCDGMWPRKLDADHGLIPCEWRQFEACAERLLSRIPTKESADACREIIGRYVRKVASLKNMPYEGVYTNTGLAQAGLEIGWRLESCAEVADYFSLMPVSVGVVLLWADKETLVERNKARGRDRSHMVEGMEVTRIIASGVLSSRRVPVLQLDTRSSVIENRAKIAAWCA